MVCQLLWADECICVKYNWENTALMCHAVTLYSLGGLTPHFSAVITVWPIKYMLIMNPNIWCKSHLSQWNQYFTWYKEDIATGYHV